MLLPSWDGLDTEGSHAGPRSVPDFSQRCGYDYSPAGVTTGPSLSGGSTSGDTCFLPLSGCSFSVPTLHLHLTYLIFEESCLVLTTCQGLNEAKDLGNQRRHVACCQGYRGLGDSGEVAYMALAPSGRDCVAFSYPPKRILASLCYWACEAQPASPARFPGGLVAGPSPPPAGWAMKQSLRQSPLGS